MLVVEYRDEVYHRLEANLRCAGFRVTRAYCASEGIIQYFMFRPDLVIANVDLPDQSGWLLTAKLCVTDPLPHVWLYKSDATRADAAKASFLGAEELLAYRTVQDLSNALFACLAGEMTSLTVGAHTQCGSHLDTRLSISLPVRNALITTKVPHGYEGTCQVVVDRPGDSRDHSKRLCEQEAEHGRPRNAGHGKEHDVRPGRNVRQARRAGNGPDLDLPDAPPCSSVGSGNVFGLRHGIGADRHRVHSDRKIIAC